MYKRFFILAAAVACAVFFGGCISPSVSSIKSPSGSLSLETTPQGAMVYVDGIHRGLTPIRMNDLSPGTHIINLTKEGYKDRKFNVKIIVGRVGERMVPLISINTSSNKTKAKGGANNKRMLTGNLSISSDPQGATIILEDNKVLGVTPFVASDMSAGVYMLNLTKSGFESKVVKLRIIPGRTIEQMVKLRPVRRKT